MLEIRSRVSKHTAQEKFVPTKDGVRNVEDHVIINLNYLYKSKTA